MFAFVLFVMSQRRSKLECLALVLGMLLPLLIVGRLGIAAYEEALKI